MADVFLGGVETVSTTLTWVVLFLARYPDIQDKLWDELNRVIPRSRYASLSDRPR